MLLSIITVCYNDLLGLRRTLESTSQLLNEFQDIEQIVVDGGSSDGTYEFLRNFSTNSTQFRFVHEADEGIYDAMNKGIVLSEGRFLLFLNSGDELLKDFNSAMREIRSSAEQGLVDILGFGYESYCLKTQTRKLHSPNKKIRNWFLRMPTSHQAMLFSSRVLREHSYNSNLKVSGDFELVCRLSKLGIIYRSSSTPLSRFYLGGVSSNQRMRLFEESTSSILQYNRPMLWIPLRLATLLVRVFIR